MNGDATSPVKHDIGLMTAARLVAICWAGLVPIAFPAWLIIQGEIAKQNSAQDVAARREYLNRNEFEERMRLLDERARVNTDILREVREEQRSQRVTLETFTRKGKS